MSTADSESDDATRRRISVSILKLFVIFSNEMSTACPFLAKNLTFMSIFGFGGPLRRC